jgi:hypothetical protein
VLPAPLAAELAARADAVASKLDAGDSCGARAQAEALQADAIAAVNAGRVPAAYQEELGAAVSSLVASIECTPPSVADNQQEEDEDAADQRANGNGKAHGKGEDKGKHKGKKK